MNSTPRLMRPLLVAAVAVALASTGACSWFKSKSTYTQSVENRPLEVPPDLDLPDTTAATALPTAGGQSSGRAAAGVDVSLSGSATDAYPRIGKVLEGINGLVINGKAEALGSYDVTYQGQNFLIRVMDSAGGSRMVALSPDGRVLKTGPAVELMKTIRSEL